MTKPVEAQESPACCRAFLFGVGAQMASRKTGDTQKDAGSPWQAAVEALRPASSGKGQEDAFFG